MAIWLFIMLTMNQLYAAITIVTNKTPIDRVGAVITSAILAPPYIWFGWFSGLVF